MRIFLGVNFEKIYEDIFVNNEMSYFHNIARNGKRK